MVSEKQITANRRNALKSTGPRTEEGKAVASRNAVRHGLLSSETVIGDENEEEFELFRERMLTDLAPESELECVLADRIVASAWRLRRAVRIERDILDADLARDRSSKSSASSTPPPLGSCMNYSLLYTDKYGKVSRYEAHIERGMYKALHELQRLQAARAGQQVAAPVAVDVEVSGSPQKN